MAAAGEFTCNLAHSTSGCVVELQDGHNTMTLQFDLSGGPVSGTGSGEGGSRTPHCTFVDKLALAFTGSFDPATRQLHGTAALHHTEEITRGPLNICFPPLPGTRVTPAAISFSDTTRPWQAALALDGRTVNGMFTDGGSADSTFVLMIR